MYRQRQGTATSCAVEALLGCMGWPTSQPSAHHRHITRMFIARESGEREIRIGHSTSSFLLIIVSIEQLLSYGSLDKLQKFMYLYVFLKINHNSRRGIIYCQVCERPWCGLFLFCSAIIYRPARVLLNRRNRYTHTRARARTTWRLKCLPDRLMERNN